MDNMAIATGLVGELFEDTLDGYFPLHVSLRHMLQRKGYASAVVTLQYAPIMHIPGLAHDAPVPLNIKTGIAGMIEKMSFCVTPNSMCGMGTWHWLVDDNSKHPFDANKLEPMTRLAEPCYITGCGFAPGELLTALLGSVNQSTHGNAEMISRPTKFDTTTSIWGPFRAAQIRLVDSPFAMHGEYETGLHDEMIGEYISHTS